MSPTRAPDHSQVDLPRPGNVIEHVIVDALVIGNESVDVIDAVDDPQNTCN